MPFFSPRNKDQPTPQSHDQTPERPQRTLPPHMQRIVDERSAPTISDEPSIDEQRNAYERRRVALQFDIDQGELASSPENPWTHRIELLTEALANVEADLREAEQVVPGPYHPVPSTPIREIAVSRGDGIALTFVIDGQGFAFDEVLDWAERGNQIARPELIQAGGDATALVPSDTPADLVDALAAHLTASVTTFATDLRDRVLDEEPLPSSPTLDELARPCPVCGGWTDWKGHCDTCSQRKARVQHLFRERQHLLRERSSELEERHRLADRLPLARHRMRDLENEIMLWERSLKR
jgi:hypothetical protein